MNKKAFKIDFEQGSSSVSCGDVPISVNIPVTNKCNYDCSFCFGKFKQLPDWVDDSRIMELPEILSSMGTRKITLEGGEPFLYDKTSELLKEIKRCGMTSCVITNGSLLTEGKLKSISSDLDWLGLSVDSTSEKIEKELGRGNGDHINQVKKIANWCKDLDIKLKANTVVTELNKDEDLKGLIKELDLERYKILKLLIIQGENDHCKDKLGISDREYYRFVERHKSLEEKGIKVVSEDNDDMTDTYLMLLPNGKFLNNHGGNYSVSEHSILTDDPEKAFKEAIWDSKKFIERGGIYEY